MKRTKFKTISISEQDYEKLDLIRQTWVKQHKVNISLAKMINIAMEEYKLALKV